MSMGNMANTPTLRFQTGKLAPDGTQSLITEPWEKKPLADLVYFSKGKGYSKADISESGTPLFLYGRMYTKYQTEVVSVDTFAQPRQGAVLSKGTEVVIPASGETPEDIARASAITRDGIILGGDLNILTPKNGKDIDSAFLALSLSNGETAWQIAERAQGKTVVHIHNSDFQDLIISSPDLPEQQAISSFFHSLDVLIDARGKALGKLDALKKAMLQKMFPQGDAKTPEVRFKGFEGGWETTKIEALLTIGNGKDYKYLELGLIPVYGTGGYMTSVSDCLYDGPSVCIGRKGTIDKPLYLEGKFWTVDTLFYSYAFGKNNPYFIYCLFQTIDWTSYNAASGVPSLSKEAINGIHVSIPSTPEEQQKIGKFFRSLDALLAAQREEVGKLRDLKKALLERMFI